MISLKMETEENWNVCAIKLQSALKIRHELILATLLLTSFVSTGANLLLQYLYLFMVRGLRLNK